MEGIVCIYLPPPEVTDADIYEAGKFAFKRGWKNIPPYSIASIRRDPKKPTTVRVWQDGWSHAKAEAEGLTA
jgi:hypothetical protein